MTRRFSAWMALAILAGLVGCGGGGGGVSESPQVVVKVAIRQSGLILTQKGALSQLSATVTDAEGNEFSAPTTWTSTRPANITVDGTGKVTAASASGSSQIVAEAGGIKSAPLLAVIAQPVAGAILLTDAQIVGDPVETTPEAVPSFDNTYQVSLTGIAAPAVGSILINTESKAVAGRVLQVDSASVPIKVTLGQVSLRELFTELVIDETIDLANAPIRMNPEIAAAYDVKRTGNTFDFTPKPVPASAAAVRPGQKADAAATGKLGPFKCETSITGGEGASLPIVLSAPPLFSVTVSPTVDAKFDLFTVTGVERFVINAEPTIKFEGGISVAVAFEGKIECKVELFAYPIPVGGPLSLIIGGVVPVGIGMEAGGKLTLATMGIGTKAEIKGKVKAGIACPGGNYPCSFERGLDITATMTPTVDLPTLGDVRVEPSLSGFGYMETAIGNAFLKSLRFDFVKIKSGANLAGSFAPFAAQLDDPAYSSDYKISLEASASAGGNLSDVLKLLGLSGVNALELKISTDIAKSPAGLASGAVSADKASFVIGDTVNFTVKLDPATIDFFPGLGPYNVSKVLLVRGRTLLTTVVVGTVEATAGQTEFKFAFEAPNAGSSGEFSAFVVTTLLPTDLLALEVGSAAGPTEVTVASASIRENIGSCVDGKIVHSGPSQTAANQPLPFTLSAGSSSVAFTQQSASVYVVHFSTSLPGRFPCVNSFGVEETGGSSAIGSGAFQVVPRSSGTLKVERWSEAETGVQESLLQVTAGTPINVGFSFAGVQPIGSGGSAFSWTDVLAMRLTIIPTP